MSWLRYLKILSYFLYAVFKVHIWPTSLLLHQSSELWIFCKLSKLWSLVKPAYHNSTSLLIGLTPVSRSSPFTVLFPTELTYRCLFLYEQVPTCFFLWSGAHLLSHIVSNAVPSAACVLTVVFGMGTGVSPKRIDTGSFIYLARYFRA